MNPRIRIAIALMIALSSTLAVSPARAAYDHKEVNAVICQPYGPNTLISELSYTQKGITNPGTTNESVLCAVAADAQTAYTSTPGVIGTLVAFYQAGAIPGRVACTAFVSNAAIATGPIYTVTVNPANSAAGVRANFEMPLADTGGYWTVAAPTVALCTITPKATLAGFTLYEAATTNAP